MKEKDSAVNNSTLSLSIAAYGNAFESDSETDTPDNFSSNQIQKKEFHKNWKAVKQFFEPHSAMGQSTFEFPRQEENDRDSKPEVAHFKAKQKLLNPNASNSTQKRAANITLKLPTFTTAKNSQQKIDQLRNLRNVIASSIPVKDGTNSINQLQVTNKNEALKDDNVPKTSNFEKDQKTIAALRTGMDDYDKKLNEERKKFEKKLATSRTDLNTLRHQLTRSKKLNDKTTGELEAEIAKLKTKMENQEIDFNIEFEKWKNLSQKHHDTVGSMRIEILHGMAKLKVAGVANEKMGDVIEGVFGMAGLTPNRVPSASTA
uniref:Uncharacterized protein n=1 Tax=Panagrolaimus sp. ES5 TaxID=591445 RepID=A0AC34G4C0_9BILA